MIAKHKNIKYINFKVKLEICNISNFKQKEFIKIIWP